MPLSSEDIARRIAALQQVPDGADDSGGSWPAEVDALSTVRPVVSRGTEDGGASSITPPPRYYSPLSEAADGYVEWARHPERRVYTGLPEFDAAMRGLAPGEMSMAIGHTHSGKTVLASEILLNNRTRRLAVFTPDETRELVLIKLCCIVHGVSAEHLEKGIANDDPEVVSLVRGTAIDHFPKLAVFDESLSLLEMDRAMDEVEEVWGAGAELVVFDYLDLLPDGDGIPAKANALKAWCKSRDVPLLVIHQTSRSAGADGKLLHISSGGYGGEQQSIHLLTVRRKRDYYRARIAELQEAIDTRQSVSDRLNDMLAEAKYDMERHRDTITIGLAKNKRPPARLVGDVDYLLDEDTGRISPLFGTDADRITPLGREMGVPSQPEFDDF